VVDQSAGQTAETPCGASHTKRSIAVRGSGRPGTAGRDTLTDVGRQKRLRQGATLSTVFDLISTSTPVARFRYFRLDPAAVRGTANAVRDN